MPDTKFSWLMLKEHMRRYLWIYLAGIAVCLVLTNLLWTTTRPRPTNEESVIVYMVGGYGDAQPLQSISGDLLARGRARDERLKEVDFQLLQYDGAQGDYTGSMLLLTRLAVGEGDAFIASEAGMNALAQYGTLLPLEAPVASGWLSGYGLEPYYAELEDEETGTVTRFMAGLRLDSVNGLAALGAFENRGAFLCLSTTSENIEAAMEVLDGLLEYLTTEADHAGTEGQ